MSLPDALANKNVEGGGARAQIQKLGAYLSGMIMPNIAAFIAWGLITALFIPTGWLGDWSQAGKFSVLVAPMIFFLLPLLIGYTGGRIVHGQRGAVIGAIATMGVIVPSASAILIVNGTTADATDATLLHVVAHPRGIPMFLGAMIIGPLAAYLLKLVDRAVEDKVPAGFEMLVENFSAGILGMLMAMLGVVGVGPIADKLITWAGNGVETLVNHHLLPLASLFVEPAKVLFLNNAINHGVLTPLGTAQALDHGKSILFMVESNPGPGAGLLLAYFFFGPKALRPSVPGALIIQFLGGIHEIYFPYVLMRPQLILAPIAGGMSGLAVGNALHAGLVAPPAPGSIFAYFAETPKGFGNWFAVYADVGVALAVSFLVASALFGFGRAARNEKVHRPEDEVLVGS
jgi:PTS system mannitol-specific IIC component